MIRIEAADASDRSAIETLLESNGLPIEGLELALGNAVVAREGGRVIGSAAVEVHGSAGLLRSVCVDQASRGTGLGRLLVERAEALASAGGVDELFLLTETAADWFPRLGYERGPREAAPPELLDSPEFALACPDSAALFRKRLS